MVINLDYLYRYVIISISKQREITMETPNITEIAGQKFVMHQPVITAAAHTLLGHTLDSFKLRSIIKANWVFELGGICMNMALSNLTVNDRPTAFHCTDNSELGRSLDGLLRAVKQKPRTEWADIFADTTLLEQTVGNFLNDFSRLTGIHASNDDAGKIFEVLSYVDNIINESVPNDLETFVFEVEGDEGIVLKPFKDLEDFDVIYNAIPINTTPHPDTLKIFRNNLWQPSKILGSITAITDRMAELRATELKLDSDISAARADYLNIKEAVKCHNGLMKDRDEALEGKMNAANERAQEAIRTCIDNKEQQVVLLKKTISNTAALERYQKQREAQREALAAEHKKAQAHEDYDQK